MKTRSHIVIPVLLACLWYLSGCSADLDTGTPKGFKGETAEISVLADIPGSGQVATRAGGTAAENAVADIYILVFDKVTDNLIYKSRGRNLSRKADPENSNRLTFKATLPVGSEYTFMLLANAGELHRGMEVGMDRAVTKTDVEAVTVSQTGKWDHTDPAIPMWSQKDLTLTASTTPSFELTRMLARVNVAIELREISGTKPDNFRLTSVRYYNYNTNGLPVPGKGNYDFVNRSALYPTIPDPSGNRTGECLVYSGSDIEQNLYCREKIYVFEAAHNGSTYGTPPDNAAWIDNPCIVIGGQYRTEDGTWLDETYYRIDFIRKDLTEGGEITDTWLSVLRNFSYNITVVEVGGAGYPDPDTALRSAPINMEANILEWNEREMENIVFDGVFYLSVSRDEFTLQRTAVRQEMEDYTVYIKTDYTYANNPSDPRSGWYVEKCVDGEDDTKEADWLELNPEKGIPDEKTKAYFTFRENPENTNRTAVVWIAAGRLRYPIYVTQRIMSLDILDPDDGDRPLSRLDFVVPRTGITPHPTRRFKVDWTPADHPVSITAESPQEWSPFAPDWIDPNPATIAWSLPAGSGPRIFTVDAPTVDRSMIELDPFYEKETTYNFTVSNGDDTETKGITLHQIYYNIVVDTYNYKLDGRTYTINVRSNTDWVITGIEEWLYNKDPALDPQAAPVLLNLNNYDNLRVGVTGGPNTSGEALAFTVVDEIYEQHRNKWGTVFVTFENPDGKFEPVRAALNFPRANVTLLGLGYARDVRPFNVAFPSTYHLQGANRILTSANNFGYEPESTVQVDNFRIVGYNCEGRPASSHSPDANWWTEDFARFLNDQQPDIIVISYSMVFPQAEARMLRQYLENGGAVIMYYGGDLQNAQNLSIMMQEIFDMNLSYGDDPAASATYGVIRRSSYPNTGAIFQFVDGEEYRDDPILNGPFGDIRGQFWGTHYSRCGVRTDLIRDQVHIISLTDSEITSQQSRSPQDPGYINIFRHKTLNLVWIGNGMGTSAYYPRYFESAPYHDVIANNDDFRPIPRPEFGPSGTTQPRRDVYNSQLFANAVAWAISVTNHTPPVDGYKY